MGKGEPERLGCSNLVSGAQVPTMMMSLVALAVVGVTWVLWAIGAVIKDPKP